MGAVLAVLLALVTGPASAGCGYVTLPPAKYDHAPTRPFRDVRMDYWKIDNACRTYWDGFGTGRLQACVIGTRIPLRIIPSDLDTQTTACLIRHENGHLNGWPSDHPGARFE